MATNREIDSKAAEASAGAGGLSGNFVELMKDFSKIRDQASAATDNLAFSQQTFSPKQGFDFLSNPNQEVRINQTAFLTPQLDRLPPHARFDGKPLT